MAVFDSITFSVGGGVEDVVELVLPGGGGGVGRHPPAHALVVQVPVERPPGSHRDQRAPAHGVRAEEAARLVHGHGGGVVGRDAPVLVQQPLQPELGEVGGRGGGGAHRVPQARPRRARQHAAHAEPALVRPEHERRHARSAVHHARHERHLPPSERDLIPSSLPE